MKNHLSKWVLRFFGIEIVLNAGFRALSFCISDEAQTRELSKWVLIFFLLPSLIETEHQLLFNSEIIFFRDLIAMVLIACAVFEIKL